LEVPVARQKTTPAESAFGTLAASPVAVIDASGLVQARSANSSISVPSVASAAIQCSVGVCDVTVAVDSGAICRGTGPPTVPPSPPPPPPLLLLLVLLELDVLLDEAPPWPPPPAPLLLLLEEELDPLLDEAPPTPPAPTPFEPPEHAPSPTATVSTGTDKSRCEIIVVSSQARGGVSQLRRYAIFLLLGGLLAARFPRP
jgi:hypothetical protein